MMSINELFGANTTTTVSSRSLQGTAELTNLSARVADGIIKAMEADIENYRDRLQKSATDAKELDALIDELGEINPDDAEFLTELDDHTIDGMLKSQQSKRSRSKSKQMTLDNYRRLMTAAVAENIIRIVTDKPKNYTGARSSFGTVNYTIEQLEMLGNDQNALRKEIRNVQSKKSIMKSKADFDESDERWQALLKAEQQLKDMRIGGNTQIVEVDNTKNALIEMFEGVDIAKLKSAEAHEMLENIFSMIAE